MTISVKKITCVIISKLGNAWTIIVKLLSSISQNLLHVFSPSFGFVILLEILLCPKCVLRLERPQKQNLLFTRLHFFFFAAVYRTFPKWAESSCLCGCKEYTNHTEPAYLFHTPTDNLLNFCTLIAFNLVPLV